jgi:hypothetical protein
MAVTEKALPMADSCANEYSAACVTRSTLHNEPLVHYMYAAELVRIACKLAERRVVRCSQRIQAG